MTPQGDSFRAWVYAPPDAVTLEEKDGDLGSGGAMIRAGLRRGPWRGKSGYMVRARFERPWACSSRTTHHNQYNAALRGETWDKGPHLHGLPSYWAGPESTHGYL